jgi:excisionase family DNA binding protein
LAKGRAFRSPPVVRSRGAHLQGMDIEDRSNPWGLEPLLDVAELASYLGVPVSTVYGWRTRSLGPCAYPFGKHLKFALSDVRDWIEQQRDPGPAGR